MASSDSASVNELTGLQIKKLFIALARMYVFPMQQGTVRRTKIVSTLGPATDSAEMIGKLMDAGVNIFRLNMSHAPHDWVRRVSSPTSAPNPPGARATPAS